MWNSDYQLLSRLWTRDNRIAELAWRDGKLYFAQHAADDIECHCDERAVEVAKVEDAPQQETQILESASYDQLYILSGDRAFRSRCRGERWEEI
ncbi:MAG: hypothetical protein M3347_11135 [Armatimonadota bacterium]|nr:hypothetical protein [Armatimonadota bacterium]